MQDKIKLIQKEKKRKEIAWRYKNIQSLKDENIYFSENSIIAGFIKAYGKLPHGLKKEKIKKLIDTLANLKEDSPGKIDEIIILEARLNLIIYLADYKLKNKFFNLKKYYPFLSLISSCNPAQLAEISPYLDFLKSNPYNLAVAIKLFFENKMFTKKGRNLFKIIKKISCNKKDCQAEAARVMLIATGLNQKIITKKRLIKETNKITIETISYKDLNLKQYPLLCSFLINPRKINERKIRASWFEDFLPVTLDFPVEEVTKTLKGYNFVENNPLEVEGYILVPDDSKFYGDNCLMAINQHDYLGRGSYGNVYKFFLLDDNGNIVAASPWSIKIIANARRKMETGLTQDCAMLELEKEAYYFSRVGLRAGQPRKYKVERGKNGLPEQEYMLPLEFVKKEFYLEEFLKNIPFNDVARVAFEYAMTVAHIHKKGLFHGDLKAVNVLFSKALLPHGKWRYQVVPIDYGMTTHLPLTENPHEHVFFNQGKRDMRGPEITTQNLAYHVSDIYSSAFIYQEIFKKLSEIKTENEYSYIARCMDNFIRRCLETDPIKRIRDEEILTFLIHLMAFIEMSTMTEKALKKYGLTEKDRNTHGMRCILISENLWNEEVKKETGVKFCELEFDEKLSKKIIQNYIKYSVDKTRKKNSSIKKYRTIVNEYNASKKYSKAIKYKKSLFEFKSQIEQKMLELKNTFIRETQIFFKSNLSQAKYQELLEKSGLENKIDFHTTTVERTFENYMLLPDNQDEIDFLFTNHDTKKFVEMIELYRILSKIRDVLIVADDQKEVEALLNEKLLYLRKDRKGNVLNTYQDVLKEAGYDFSAFMNSKLYLSFFNNSSAFFQKNLCQKNVSKETLPPTPVPDNDTKFIVV